MTSTFLRRSEWRQWAVREINTQRNLLGLLPIAPHERDGLPITLVLDEIESLRKRVRFENRAQPRVELLDGGHAA